MRKLLPGVLVTIGLGAATAAVVVMAGVVNVAADAPHSSLTHQLLAFAREQAIARRSADIELPADLGDPERVRRGAGNYAAMCVDCHLSPGAPDSEIRQGLYPKPPNLSEKPAAARDAARDFWIIKHGIKASGMPAWSKGGMEDEAIWDLAVFVQQLPALSATAYAQLVAASDGHAHGGLDGHDHGPGGHQAAAMATAPEKPVQAPVHDHGSHDHGTHKH